ncbi:MAG: T9SS type A sorting domain-containing protein [Lentimicrobium sp.]|nr:T9SS type A sorting domain-containing protein [Lentimicrobium sp.]
MKNTIGILLLLLTTLISSHAQTTARHINRSDALTVAGNYLNLRHPEQSPGTTEALKSGADTLAWLIHCLPQGFVLVSDKTYHSPLIAWSDESNFGEGEAWESFLPILKKDLKLRNQFYLQNEEELASNLDEWAYWMNPVKQTRLFEQWPPEGWSSTGGWLFTKWTQSAPYNALCPIDGQTQIRSVAGCPATAMAQIVNFHHQLNETYFSDADDYYHNFGTGNTYWIDNDWESRGFPSWDQLNVYLDTLEAHYESGITLTNSDKAALTFACGVAAKQVYSSSGSGTFGVDQAFDAYIRFGYSEARLDGPSNPDLNTQLAQNIMLALPAHLALVNPEWTVGHNVVVDGYNTDELYHFNFGWGGSANGWYTMPPEDIPYDLTVIEGIVLDINLSNPPVEIDDLITTRNKQVMIFYNRTGNLQINYPDKANKALLTIFDNAGRYVMQTNLNMSSQAGTISVSLLQLPAGIYIAKLETEKGVTGSCKFIR